jgi:hypothetical protein
MHRNLAAALATVLVAGCSTATPAPSPALFWRVVYNGYGYVVQSPGPQAIRFTLVPARPASAADTHAALVLSRGSWRDITAQVRLRTNRQLRRPHPNPWEVGWLLWHYRDDQHYYYIALKPNGWELGKEDPAYPSDQRFLATGTHPVFPPGRWYTIVVQQSSDVITVNVDGHRLVRFTDTQNPYRSGHIGLYTEDASATFQPVTIQAIP